MPRDAPLWMPPDLLLRLGSLATRSVALAAGAPPATGQDIAIIYGTPRVSTSLPSLNDMRWQAMQDAAQIASQNRPAWVANIANAVADFQRDLGEREARNPFLRNAEAIGINPYGAIGAIPGSPGGAAAAAPGTRWQRIMNAPLEELTFQEIVLRAVERANPGGGNPGDILVGGVLNPNRPLPPSARQLFTDAEWARLVALTIRQQANRRDGSAALVQRLARQYLELEQRIGSRAAKEWLNQVEASMEIGEAFVRLREDLQAGRVKANELTNSERWMLQYLGEINTKLSKWTENDLPTMSPAASDPLAPRHPLNPNELPPKPKPGPIRPGPPANPDSNVISRVGGASGGLYAYYVAAASAQGGSSGNGSGGGIPN